MRDCPEKVIVEFMPKVYINKEKTNYSEYCKMVLIAFIPFKDSINSITKKREPY